MPRQPASRAPDKAISQPPFGLVAASLLCAFGFWFTPSVLVVYTQLASSLYQPVEGFLLLSVSALSAAGFRWVMDEATDSQRDMEHLLVVLLALVMSSMICLWLLRAGLDHPPRLYMLAVISGVGGGSFVSLCRQGAVRHSEGSLEAPSVMAHLGIVMALLMVPLLLTLPVIFDSENVLLTGSSHFLGRTAVGSPIAPAWPALVWLLWSLVLLVWAGVGCRGQRLCAGLCLQGLGRLLLWLAGILAVALALWLLGTETVGLAFHGLLLVVSAVVVGRPWGARWRDTGRTRAWLWPLGLGSFLGFSAVFPLLTLTVFQTPHQTPTVAYPAIFLYAWMLPLGAVLMRPVAHGAIRRWGGRRLVYAGLLGVVVALVSLAWWIYCAQLATYAPRYFLPYLLSFALLFACLGLVNGALAHEARLLSGQPAMAALGMAMISLLMAVLVERVYLAPLVFTGVFMAYGLAGVLPPKKAASTSL